MPKFKFRGFWCAVGAKLKNLSDFRTWGLRIKDEFKDDELFDSMYFAVLVSPAFCSLLRWYLILCGGAFMKQKET